VDTIALTDGIRKMCCSDGYPTTNGNDNHKSANIRQAVLALVKRRLLVPLAKWGDCADARVESEPVEIYACATERSAVEFKGARVIEVVPQALQLGLLSPEGIDSHRQ
jgi:hypothetical protein